MGALTRDTIVSEAGLLAGDDSLAARANVWFNAWLRSQYRAWPWPYLHRRATGIPLSLGATTISVGAGGSSITLEIQRIFDPLWLYTSDFRSKGRPRIRELIGGDIKDDETVNDSTQGRGQPTMFKVRASTTLWGQWSLIPKPVPDKAYLLAIDYLVQPADIATGSDVPVYPNDRTMIQAVLADIYRYKGDERASEALDILSFMVADDRMKFGEVPGTNTLTALDPGIFR